MVFLVLSVFYCRYMYIIIEMYFKWICLHLNLSYFCYLRLKALNVFPFTSQKTPNLVKYAFEFDQWNSFSSINTHSWKGGIIQSIWNNMGMFSKWIFAPFLFDPAGFSKFVNWCWLIRYDLIRASALYSTNLSAVLALFLLWGGGYWTF